MPTSLSPVEILVILVIALIVLGPKRLPEAGRQVGRAIAEVRRWSRGVQSDIRDAFDAADEPPLVSGATTPATPSPSRPEEAEVQVSDGVVVKPNGVQTTQTPPDSDAGPLDSGPATPGPEAPAGASAAAAPGSAESPPVPRAQEGSSPPAPPTNGSGPSVEPPSG